MAFYMLYSYIIHIVPLKNMQTKTPIKELVKTIIITIIISCLCQNIILAGNNSLSNNHLAPEPFTERLKGRNGLIHRFFFDVVSDETVAWQLYEAWEARGGNENYSRGIMLARKYRLAEGLRTAIGEEDVSRTPTELLLNWILMAIYMLDRDILTVKQYGLGEAAVYRSKHIERDRFKEELFQLSGKYKIIDLTQTTALHSPRLSAEGDPCEDIVTVFRKIHDCLDDDGVLTLSLKNKHPAMIKALQVAGFEHRIDKYSIVDNGETLVPFESIGTDASCDNEEHVFTGSRLDLNKFLIILENLSEISRKYGIATYVRFLYLNVGVPFVSQRNIGPEILLRKDIFEEACAILDQSHIVDISSWLKIAEMSLAKLPDSGPDVLPLSNRQIALQERRYYPALELMVREINPDQDIRAFNELMAIVDDEGVDDSARKAAAVALGCLGGYAQELRPAIQVALSSIKQKGVSTILNRGLEEALSILNDPPAILLSACRQMYDQALKNAGFFIPAGRNTNTLLDVASAGVLELPEAATERTTVDYSESSRQRLFEELEIHGGCSLEDVETVQLFLTYKCQLHCRHCYLGKAKNSIADMDAYLHDTIIAQLSRNKHIVNVTYNGGETTLRRIRSELLKGLSKLDNKWIALMTNLYWAKSPETVARLLSELFQTYQRPITFNVSLNDFVFEQTNMSGKQRIPISNFINTVKALSTSKYASRINLTMGIFDSFVNRKDTALSQALEALSREGLLAVDDAELKQFIKNNQLPILCEDGTVKMITLTRGVLDFIGDADRLDEELYEQDEGFSLGLDTVEVSPWGEVSLGSMLFGILPLGTIEEHRPLERILQNARKDPLVYFLAHRFYGIRYLIALAQLLEPDIAYQFKGAYSDEAKAAKLLADSRLKYFLTKMTLRVMLTDLRVVKNEDAQQFKEITGSSDIEFMRAIKKEYMEAKNKRAGTGSGIEHLAELEGAI